MPALHLCVSARERTPYGYALVVWFLAAGVFTLGASNGRRVRLCRTRVRGCLAGRSGKCVCYVAVLQLVGEDRVKARGWPEGERRCFGSLDLPYGPHDSLSGPRRESGPRGSVFRSRSDS
jgi:hypothetical protein